jgi:hypothetical protein
LLGILVGVGGLTVLGANMTFGHGDVRGSVACPILPPNGDHE